MTAVLELLEIPLEDVHLSDVGNDRETFGAGELEALAGSMATSGQLTPITVRPRPAGGWELVHLHFDRRLFADSDWAIELRLLMATVRAVPRRAGPGRAYQMAAQIGVD